MDSLWKSLAENFVSNRKNNFLWSYTCRSTLTMLGVALGLKAQQHWTGCIATVKVPRPPNLHGRIQAAYRERSLLNPRVQLGSGIVLDSNYGPKMYWRLFLQFSRWIRWILKHNDIPWCHSYTRIDTASRSLMTVEQMSWATADFSKKAAPRALLQLIPRTQSQNHKDYSHPKQIAGKSLLLTLFHCKKLSTGLVCWAGLLHARNLQQIPHACGLYCFQLY